jgi:hypothetical protein
MSLVSGDGVTKADITHVKRRFIWRTIVLEMGLPIGVVSAIYQIFIAASPHSLGLVKSLVVLLLNVVGWPCLTCLLALAMWQSGIFRRFLPDLEAEDE